MTDDAEHEVEEVAHDTRADRAGNETRAERDATIQRLERAIADERQHSAELRRSAEELRFKMDILERSYSKQLEDARSRAESAEQKLSEHGIRIAELDGARNDAIELLTEAKAELDRLNTERNQLRKQLASRDGWQVEGAGEAVDSDDGEGTINALMNDDRWLSRAESEHQKQIRERKATEVVEEAQAEDMLSPELVFTRKSGGD